MPADNPLCIAIDTADLEVARGLARRLKPHAGFFKVGMELFYAQGMAGYEAVAAAGVPVFLDLKLHDIPNTVAKGLTSLLRMSPPPAIVNVHASGGLDMMRAASEAVAGRAKLIAVTVLTSLADDDIWAAGFDHTRSTRSHARNLAELAVKAGLDGVVCSPHEVESIRHVTPTGFLTVVPGVRPAESGLGDQKRVATPQAALDAGADILVIGRPITGAADPAAAAQSILEDLNAR
jgi:orotidine-5'-phosphate decarboxylase